MKVTNTNDPKAPLFIAIVFGVVGAFQLFMYWNGLVSWVRICSMSYEEVRITPFLPIWTSMRAVGGIIFLVASLIWFLRYVRLKRSKGHDVANTY